MCDHVTGKCICNSGSTGVACEKSKLIFMVWDFSAGMKFVLRSRLYRFFIRKACSEQYMIIVDVFWVTIIYWLKGSSVNIG